MAGHGAKQFSDPIYKYIEVEPFALKIVDTPHFQRLRNLRQLGTVSFVYSAADQTRFQHSLGVYHLTRYSLELLNSRLPEGERVPQQAQKIVKIAALTHDLGHGPFSHLFEQVQEECRDLLGFKVQNHEEWSCEIVRRILLPVQVRESLGISSTDVESVCNLILGLIPDDPVFKKYQFLNEIVSNSISGLDTDKMDYLARDSYAIGNGISIEPMRIISHQQLFQKEGKFYIANSFKTRDNIELIYSTRKYMQKQIYRHPKVLAFDLLVKRIFKKAIMEKTLDLDSYYLSSDVMLPDDRILCNLANCSGDLLTLLEQLNKHCAPRVVFNYFFGAESLICALPHQGRKEEFIKQIAQISQLDESQFDIFIADSNYGVKYNDPAKFILFHANGNVYVPKEFEILYFSQQLTPIQRKQFLVQKVDPRFKEAQMTVFCDREAPESTIIALKRAITQLLTGYGALSCEASMLLGATQNPQIFQMSYQAAARPL